MNIAIAHHREAAALDILEAEWSELWQRSPTATPFQHPTWLRVWWKVFAPGDLFVVTARVDGKLIGIAPFYLESGPLGRRLLPLGISVSDYIDILLDPRHARSAAAAIVEHVGAGHLDWDEWELPDLIPDAASLDLPCPASAEDSTGHQSPCPLVILPASGGSLRDAIPARKWRKLSMARNRAGRREVFRIERVQTSDVPAAFRELVEFHRHRWHRGGEATVLADPLGRKFHEAAMVGMAGAGLARIYRAELDGRTAGIYYGFLHRDRAYGYLIGFDPEFSFESPGTLLLGHAMEEAIGEGARIFDFLRGAEPYKYEWGAVDSWTKRRVFGRVSTEQTA